jgi:hypothetical protein
MKKGKLKLETIKNKSKNYIKKEAQQAIKGGDGENNGGQIIEDDIVGF